MAHQVKLDALQSHKLSAFYMALVLLYSDLPLKEIDEIIRQEGFEEIERTLFENIAHKPEKQKLLSIEQIENIIQLLKSIGEGNEDEILQLATVAERNEKMAHLLAKARRYLLKKNKARTRSKEEWIDGSESLLESLSSSTTSLLTHIRDISEQKETKATCYVHAEMDEAVILENWTTLEVTLSREILEATQDSILQTGSAEVSINKSVLVEVIPTAKFTVDGKDRVEVLPPFEDRTIRFNLRAIEVGKGEVLLVVSQGQVPLVHLNLQPSIVQNRAERTSITRTSRSNSFATSTNFSEVPHKLTIYEHRQGQEIFYEYRLTSRSLDLLDARFNSKPIQGDRTEYVRKLYKKIEERWLYNREDYQNFAQELRVFGGSLYDELFPIQLQEILWKYQDTIDSIMVHSEEPFIPWELVHLKPPGQKRLPNETKFLGQMGLVRWLWSVDSRWPPEQIRIRQHKARYLVPKYPAKTGKLPQSEQECRFLKEKFAATSIESNRSAFSKVLSTPGEFDLLHFAGHCEAELDNVTIEARLLLGIRFDKIDDKEVESPDYFDSTMVEQTSHFDKANSPLIVLNACQSGRSGSTLTSVGGFAKSFLEGGAGAFVGPLWSVEDTSSRVFTETLYKELLKGANLAKATVSARNQAKKLGNATWLAYAVYGHPNLKVTRST